MDYNRKYSRFNVQFADPISGRLSSHPDDFRLMTLGGGGCAFIGQTDISNLIPPMKLMISLEFFKDDRCLYSKDVVGELLYVRPHNPTQGWTLGFAFGKDDRTAILPMVDQLEQLAERGVIERE